MTKIMTFVTNYRLGPRLFLLGLTVLVLVAGYVPKASAACGPFPRIPLWKSLSHDLVRQQVEDAYDGDWQTYIAKLELYEDKLRGIRKRGTAAVVTWKNRQIRIKGETIDIFLGQVDRRLKVTRCLAEHDGIANFSTAAGGTGAGPAFLAEARSRTATSGQCRPFPNIAWWKLKSHESVTGYVFRKFRGNWRAYIDSWSRRLSKLQDIQVRGSSAVTNAGELLKGPRLAAYIDKIRTRISITRCLAEKMGGSNT